VKGNALLQLRRHILFFSSPAAEINLYQGIFSHQFTTGQEKRIISRQDKYYKLPLHII